MEWVAGISGIRNLIGLFRLWYMGIGITHHPLLGIACQKYQYPLLTAATLGNVVFLKRFLITVSGYRMEIQIKGTAAREPELLDPYKPVLQELSDPAIPDA